MILGLPRDNLDNLTRKLQWCSTEQSGTVFSNRTTIFGKIIRDVALPSLQMTNREIIHVFVASRAKSCASVTNR